MPIGAMALKDNYVPRDRLDAMLRQLNADARAWEAGE